MSTRPVYDCDTSPYWCPEEDYREPGRPFGRFLEEGRAYRIEDPRTPRPWLNYLANARFGAVVSNRGLGFHWHRSTLLRITRYDHPIDYLPRDFKDGRTLTFRDQATGTLHSLLPDGQHLVCTHRPGSTTLAGEAGPLAFELTLFVPLEEPAEVWDLTLTNRSGAPVAGTLALQQIWSIANFGIHTAEEGIPYLSTPGQDLTLRVVDHGLEGFTNNRELPMPLWVGFFSPQCGQARVEPLVEQRHDGRVFTFNRAVLEQSIQLPAGASLRLQAAAIATETEEVFRRTREAVLRPGFAAQALEAVRAKWAGMIERPSCRLPDANLQNFLNVWFKNQLNLTFYFCRSGHNGYRDTLQDAWGFALLDPALARAKLKLILSHQNADGTAPRNFSAFGTDQHDHRRFMDSPVWIARTLVDLVKETGDTGLLAEKVPFLDGSEASVEEHAWRALDILYRNRNAQGLCYTGDGDWNDALEGISRDGDAVSAWLTIALYDAMQFMIDLYVHTGRQERLAVIQQRAREVRDALNRVAWDGHWYVYGFTGKGKPIGSHTNREGKIHLNAQAWAVFSGVADRDRAKQVMDAVESHLATPLGPALLAPPYVHEGHEVGRIARLEPGTFENGAVYQHAVAFHLLACLTLGRAGDAVDILNRLLPTNPENFDRRRTSEPYCTGNYYCGPGHARFGQNFFSWFTGNAAWFLRLGFDQLLGVKAGFDGLEINPCVPDAWSSYEVTRAYRGCTYHLRFERKQDAAAKGIFVEGQRIEGNRIPVQVGPACSVQVRF